jgi:hypothetical protein
MEFGQTPSAHNSLTGFGVAANAPAGEPGVEVVGVVPAPGVAVAALFDVGDAEVPGAVVEPFPVVLPMVLVVLPPPDISAKAVPATPSSTITIPAMSIALPIGWLRNPRDDVDDGEVGIGATLGCGAGGVWDGVWDGVWSCVSSVVFVSFPVEPDSLMYLSSLFWDA